jgi:hypothetical protein
MRAMPGLAGVLVSLFVMLPASAATVSFRDLTAQQIAALDASQQRLATFDRALQALDQRRARRDISLKEYKYQEHDLLAFIANEADFQNAILHKDRTDPFTLSSDQSDKLKDGCEAALVILARGGLSLLNGVSP